MALKTEKFKKIKKKFNKLIVEALQGLWLINNDNNSQHHLKSTK